MNPSSTLDRPEASTDPSPETHGWTWLGLHVCNRFRLVAGGTIDPQRQVHTSQSSLPPTTWGVGPDEMRPSLYLFGHGDFRLDDTGRRLHGLPDAFVKENIRIVSGKPFILPACGSGARVGSVTISTDDSVGSTDQLDVVIDSRPFGALEPVVHAGTHFFIGVPRESDAIEPTQWPPTRPLGVPMTHDARSVLIEQHFEPVLADPDAPSPGFNASKDATHPLVDDFIKACPMFAYVAVTVGVLSLLLRVLPPNYAAILGQYLSALHF